MLNIEINKKIIKLFQIIQFNEIKNDKISLNLIKNFKKYFIFEALHLYSKLPCIQLWHRCPH